MKNILTEGEIESKLREITQRDRERERKMDWKGMKRKMGTAD